MTENFSELTFEQIKIDQTKEFQIKITESLVDELENHFKIKFSISEITDVKTVADIKQHLKNHNVF